MSSDSNEKNQKDAEELAAIKREEARMLLPAVYSDAFQISYWKDHIRLVFGERSIKSGTYWRSAVVVETTDLKKLITRLQGILKEMEPPDQKDV